MRLNDITESQYFNVNNVAREQLVFVSGIFKQFNPIIPTQQHIFITIKHEL